MDERGAHVIIPRAYTCDRSLPVAFYKDHRSHGVIRWKRSIRNVRNTLKYRSAVPVNTRTDK